MHYSIAWLCCSVIILSCSILVHSASASDEAIFYYPDVLGSCGHIHESTGETKHEQPFDGVYGFIPSLSRSYSCPEGQMYDCALAIRYSFVLIVLIVSARHRVSSETQVRISSFVGHLKHNGTAIASNNVRVDLSRPANALHDSQAHLRISMSRKR